MEKKYTVLSLGAGVQSSTLALMANKGIIPKPDFAIFADTQSEPKSVYEWLHYLSSLLDYPVHIVKKGNLSEDCFKIKKRKKDNIEYTSCIVPVFGLSPCGEKKANLMRKCTQDYKIIPIQKKIKELCKIKRGQKECTVTQYIGISKDEMQRMKISREPYIENVYPLVDMNMRREDCVQWMKDNGYKTPPRSSCVFCAFHKDSEWRRLRNEEPDEFKKAIEFDEKLRAIKKNNIQLRMEVYLHRSCKPLSDIDFDNDIDKGQQIFDFESECEGMCGV